MLSKEEIYLRLSEGFIGNEEGILILKSYIFLRKNQEIDIIPPRDAREFYMYTKFLEGIRKWAA